jgi:hypothetical protein
MPRGGSKKGEHRGNAKPRDGIATPNHIMRSAIKQVRKPATPGKGCPVGPMRTSIEQDIQVAQVVHGRKSAFDLSPMEVVLENMHVFQQAAYTSKAMAQYLLTTPPSEARDRRITQLELDEERLRRIASDESYKVMPFVHPRRAAVQVSAAVGGSEDIIALLFEEIDRREREHPMVIEHIPTKKTA